MLGQAQPQENQQEKDDAQKEFLLSLLSEIPKQADLTLTLTRGSWATEFVEYLGSLDFRISWKCQLSSN